MKALTLSVLAVAAIRVIPSGLVFSNLNVGGSNTQTVTVSNTGRANLVISQANVTGSGLSVSGLTIPITIAAGQSISFGVRFSPTAVGNVSGSISLSSNASNSPASIALTGAGVQLPALQITTTAIPDTNVGQVYSTTLAASGGVGAYTWRVVSGQLPPGLTLNASSGVIAGITAQTGLFNLTMQVTDSSSPSPQTATRVLQLNIAVPSPSPVTTSSPNTCTTHGTQYYVSNSGNDSSNGSQANPWRTLQNAFNSVSAGATLHVAAGTYTEDNLTNNVSGTSSNRICFISDSKWGAQIRVASSRAVLTNNGNYIDMQDFDLAGMPGSCLGINNLGGNTRIIGNRVHDIPADLPNHCGGGAGIDDSNYSASDDDVIGNIVYNVGDRNNPNQLVHGIYHANLRGNILNNITFNNAGWGIHLWHGPTNVNILNNTVFNNGAGGILIGNNITVNDYTTVANNIVFKNLAYGISENTNTGTHNQYYNNLVYQNSGGNLYLKNGNTDVGTVVADPQFSNYTGTSAGDYHLKANSPAIDSGSSLAAPAYDIDWFARPYGLGFDIGAYEWHP
jgi:hypothetical protein